MSLSDFFIPGSGKVLRQFFLLGLVLAAPDALSQTLHPEYLCRAAAPGMVVIETPGGEGPGFLVNPEGFVLTNHHVITGNFVSDILVRFPDNTVFPVLRIVDVVSQLREDLALLQIQAQPGRQVLPLLPAGDPGPGSTVGVPQFPADDWEACLVTGPVFPVSNGRGPLPDFLMQVSFPAMQGATAGPVVNRNGQVAGMLVGSFAAHRMDGTWFALRPGSIRSFLRANEVGFQTGKLIPDEELFFLENLSEMEAIAWIEARMYQEGERRRQDSLDRALAQERRLEELRWEVRRQESQRRADSLREEGRRAREAEWRAQEEARRLREGSRQARGPSPEKGPRPARLGLRPGLGGQFHQSDLSRLVEGFDSGGIRPFAQAMVVYRFRVKEPGPRERGSAAGLFGQVGTLSSRGAVQLARQNDLPDVAGADYHPYWEVEAGILVREWLRLSGGRGRQYFGSGEEAFSRYYHSATVGLLVRAGRVEFDLSGTGFFGGLYRQPAARVNLGLNLYLKTARW